MSYFFLLLITIFYLFFCFYQPGLIKTATTETIDSFLKVLLPSILPMYIITNLLIDNPLFNKLTKKVSFLFKVFDSRKAITIFITNILIGSPTTVINTISQYNKKQITYNDLLILIKSSSFINPLFIINITNLLELNKIIAIFLITSNMITNYLILMSHPKKEINFEWSFLKNNIFKLLSSSLTILANIFIILLFVNLLKAPLSLINDNTIKIPFLLLEITSGITNLKHLNLHFIPKLLITIILISSNGLTICLQCINEIKKVPNSRHLIIVFFRNKIFNLFLNLLLFLIFFI